MRRYSVLTTGKMPRSVGDVLRNLERQGNPWGMPPENRVNWMDGLGIKEIAPGEKTEVLWFLGCAFAYDDRNKQAARAFGQILNSVGVDFAVMGLDETCCGETARRLGNEYLFQVFAEQNIEYLSQIKFDLIVTQCPHCLNTLKNEYPQLGGEYPVLHYTEYLEELLAEGKLTLPASSSETYTFHDPCYLGRYNQVYDAPRVLLRNASFIEISTNRKSSMCCGGGGGQMWMETDADKRLNNQRLDAVKDTGAATLLTGCPYCMLMFDDAIRSTGVGESLVVKDISEYLAEGIVLKERTECGGEV